MIKSYNKEELISHLRTLDYIWVREPIRAWRNVGKIIGWNVHSSSVLSKKRAVELLREEIEEKNLPIIVEEKSEWNNFFQIFLHDNGVKNNGNNQPHL